MHCTEDVAANISKFQLVMKPTENFSHFQLHVCTVAGGSLLVPVFYPLLHRTNWYPDKQGINTMLIDIHNTFR